MGGLFSRRRASRDQQARAATATTAQTRANDAPPSSQPASRPAKQAQRQPIQEEKKQEPEPQPQPQQQAQPQQQQPSSAAVEEKKEEEQTGLLINVQRADTEEVPDAPDATQILGGNDDEIELFAREWIPRRDLEDGQFSFTMMNFNLLADGLSGARADKASRDKTFVRVPSEYLQWEFRGPRLVAEILRWDPDVVCVEECDQFEFLLERLEGYDGQHKPKEFSPCLRIDPTFPPDGVAVFWKTSKFEMIGVHKTVQERYRMWTSDVLAQAARDALAAREEPQEITEPFAVQVVVDHLDDIPDLLTEDGKINVAQILTLHKKNAAAVRPYLALDFNVDEAELEFVERDAFVEWIQNPCLPVSCSVRLKCLDEKANGQEFFVMATHLVSAKELNGEITRQKQLKKLLHEPEVEKLMDGAQQFLGCDLNSAPVTLKGYPPLTYRYIVGTPVAGDDVSDEKDDIEAFERPFKSAMRGDGDAEIEYTTWKHREKKPGKEAEDKHTIDFLFYQDGWTVTKTLGVPTQMDVQDERRRFSVEREGKELLPSALPSNKYPSDHFSICAEFVQLSS